GPVFSPDGRWALSVQADNALTLWDAFARRRVGGLEAPPARELFRAVNLAVSPGGERVFAEARNPNDTRMGCWLWDARTGRLLKKERVLPGDRFEDFTAAVQFSADGRRLLAVSRAGRLDVLDAVTGKSFALPPGLKDVPAAAL